MIQSGLSSSVLAIVIVVLILLAVKEFVESMNDKQNAAIHREKIEEKVEEKVEELKEEIKEAKAERRDMLTWQNVTMGIMLVLAIVVVVLFSVGFYQGEKGKKLKSGFQYVISASGGVSKLLTNKPLYFTADVQQNNKLRFTDKTKRNSFLSVSAQDVQQTGDDSSLSEEVHDYFLKNLYGSDGV